MRGSAVARALLIALSMVLSMAFARPLRAAEARSRSVGHIVLSLPGGAAGPLVLAPSPGGWVGEFVVANVGSEPLTVSRVAIRGDEDDVRSPARLGVRFADGSATSATLPPGASKNVVVSWMPDRDPRVRQAFGQVVVTSTDEEAGEVSVGFRAQIPTGLGWVGEHALSLLVALPWLAALTAAGARLTGRPNESLVRRVALGAHVAELGLALWAWARFSPDVGRADGNDGFQLVERAVWVRSIGAEWYLGVDGISIALLALAAILGLVSLLLIRPGHANADVLHAAHGLLLSSVVAVVVGLDLVLFFTAWQVALVALIMLIGGWGGPKCEHAASKVAIYGALGSAAMLAAFVALSRASGRTFLVDGTAVLHTLSIPELARTSFASKGALLGVPFVEATWVLLFAAVAITTPLVPFHGWLPEALEEAPPGVAIVLGGVVVALGPFLLLRVGLGAMPEGARWAGASMASLGALSVAYGGLCAMAQHDLRRFVAYVCIVSGGTCLFGVGALTSQGIAGAVTALFARGIAAAILLGVAGILAARVRTCDMARVGALIRESLSLAMVTAAGLAVSLGVPALAGFWGLLLVLLGGFARHPVLDVVVTLALVASAAAHLRVGRLLLTERADPSGTLAPLLAPFGGRLPEMTVPERAALVPLVVLAVLFGVWPVPLFSSMAAGVRDTSHTVDPSPPDGSP